MFIPIRRHPFPCTDSGTSLQIGSKASCSSPLICTSCRRDPTVFQCTSRGLKKKIAPGLRAGGRELLSARKKHALFLRRVRLKQPGLKPIRQSTASVQSPGMICGMAEEGRRAHSLYCSPFPVLLKDECSPLASSAAMESGRTPPLTETGRGKGIVCRRATSCETRRATAAPICGDILDGEDGRVRWDGSAKVVEANPAAPRAPMSAAVRRACAGRIESMVVRSKTGSESLSLPI